MAPRLLPFAAAALAVTSAHAFAPHHAAHAHPAHAPLSSLGSEVGFRCCAGNADGRLWANTTTVGQGWGLSFFHTPGYTAADPTRNRYISAIGGMGAGTVDASAAGFFGFSCGQQSLAIVWSVMRGCRVMPLEQGVPRFCYGHDMYEDTLTGRTWIDVFTPLLHMANTNITRTTAINAFTCMPYHGTMVTGCADGGQVGVDCAAPSSAPLSVSAQSVTSISTFYANSTLWPAPPTAFSFPNWCTYDDGGDGSDGAGANAGANAGASMLRGTAPVGEQHLLGRPQRHRIQAGEELAAAGLTVREAVMCAQRAAAADGAESPAAE